MGQFTPTLNEIADVDRVEDCDVKLFGLDRYTIWDEEYRPTLNEKILMRFWFRDIGFETVDQFVHHLKRKLNEIMPYFNDLAKTAQLEYDPFETVSVSNISTLSGHVVVQGEESSESNTTATEDTEGQREVDRTENETGSERSNSQQNSRNTETGSSDNTSSSESQSRVVGSDMPQTRLNGHEDYATSSSDSASQSASQSGATTEGSSTGSQSTDTTGSSTGNKQGKEQGSETGSTFGESTNNAKGENQSDQKTTQEAKDSRIGSEGLKADMLMRYRDTLINIDVQILDALEPLFLGVWENRVRYVDPYRPGYVYPSAGFGLNAYYGPYGWPL